MAVFSRIEDIIGWQKARAITAKVYKLTSSGRFERDLELRGQIRRASVSVMANIAEGFGRNSDKEFANFLNIAHGSAYEVISHLYVALNLSYIEQDDFNSLHREVMEATRIIYGLRMSVLKNLKT